MDKPSAKPNHLLSTLKTAISILAFGGLAFTAGMNFSRIGRLETLVGEQRISDAKTPEIYVRQDILARELATLHVEIAALRADLVDLREELRRRDRER